MEEAFNYLVSFHSNVNMVKFIFLKCQYTKYDPNHENGKTLTS